MKKLTGTIALMAASCLSASAGYTHYWTWREPPSNAIVNQCVAEMNRLIQARKEILVSPDLPGSKPGELKLKDSRVDFNGFADNACEPFVFPGGTGFNFCKTSVEPYDDVVTACLIVARDHFPASILEISSDGSWEDWQAGAKLYSSVFKRPAIDPMLRPGGALRRGPALLISLGLGVLIVGALFWWGRSSREI